MPSVVPQERQQVIRKHYPNYKVIVLNDDFNTFQHV
ncbi:MAG: Clp protease ClpS, partial [Thermosynechococcus sp.]